MVVCSAETPKKGRHETHFKSLLTKLWNFVSCRFLAFLPFRCVNNYDFRVVRIGVGHFLPGGNITNPLGSMNASFIDTNDYASLQGGFPAAVKDMSQAYASLNYGQSYGGYDQGGLRFVAC